MRGIAICLGLALVAAATGAFADDEDDEGPLPQAVSVSDALVMLARGREAEAWALLEGKEAEAKPLALERLESPERLFFAGALRFLADSRIWGKEDHPAWRGKVEARLAKARAGLAKVAADLAAKGLSPAETTALRQQEQAFRVEEALCLEGVGFLGEPGVWRDLITTLKAAEEAHVLQGATRGLLGPRGGLRDLLRTLNEVEFVGESRPFQAVAERELLAVARTPLAAELVEGLEAFPSSQGLRALNRLSREADRIAAWKVMDRALRARAWQVRAAAAEVIPRLRGSRAKGAALAELLADAEEPVRVAAAKAMGLVPPSEAREELPLLVAALRDTKDVRLAAGKSLVQLTGVKLGPNPVHWERWLSKR